MRYTFAAEPRKWRRERFSPSAYYTLRHYFGVVQRQVLDRAETERSKATSLLGRKLPCDEGFSENLKGDTRLAIARGTSRLITLPFAQAAPDGAKVD